MKEGKERKQALVNVLELLSWQSIMSASSDKTESDTHTHFHTSIQFLEEM